MGLFVGLGWGQEIQGESFEESFGVSVVAEPDWVEGWGFGISWDRGMVSNLEREASSGAEPLLASRLAKWRLEAALRVGAVEGLPACWGLQGWSEVEQLIMVIQPVRG